MVHLSGAIGRKCGACLCMPLTLVINYHSQVQFLVLSQGVFASGWFVRVNLESGRNVPYGNVEGFFGHGQAEEIHEKTLVSDTMME